MIQGSQMVLKWWKYWLKELRPNCGAFGRGSWVACLWFNEERRKERCLVREAVRFLMYVCQCIVV